MWYLITDRSLKRFKLYGPFPDEISANETAVELFNRSRIKGWSVTTAQIPPRIENGIMTDIAEI
jgi:hypothetical protein